MNHLTLKTDLAVTGIPTWPADPLSVSLRFPNRGLLLMIALRQWSPIWRNSHYAPLSHAGYFFAEYRLRIWASNLTTYVLYRPTLLPGPLLTMIWVTFEWFLRHPFFVYSSKCKFPALQIWDFDRLRIWVHRGLRIWRQLYGLKIQKIGPVCIRHRHTPTRHMHPKIVGECCTKAIFYWCFRPVFRGR